jgi:hypothetical protein
MYSFQKQLAVDANQPIHFSMEMEHQISPIPYDKKISISDLVQLPTLILDEREYW